MTIEKKQWLVPYFADTTSDMTITASTQYQNGGLRDVVEPEDQMQYFLGTNGGSRMGQRFKIEGSFRYFYFNRHLQSGSMLTFPSMFPFFCSDSIKGNQTAEKYIVDGSLIFDVIENRLSIGTTIGFLASSTAKLRDVRNKNIYSDYYMSPNISAVFNKLTIGLSYRYSSMAEDVSFNTYGTNQAIFVEKVEGLWFGQRIAYTSSDFNARRHTGDEHRINVSAKYQLENSTFRGELSRYIADYKLRLRDNEKSIGDVEKKGWRGKIDFETSCQSLDFVFDTECQTSFVPIQQKEFSGTTTHYIQYGRVKRYSEINSSLYIDYKGVSERIGYGLQFEIESKHRNVFLYPQTFQQNVDRYTAIANGDCLLKESNQSVFKTLRAALSVGYSLADGSCIKRKKPSALDVNYYCNEKMLHEEFDCLSADYMIINPEIITAFKISKTLLSVTLSYQTKYAPNTQIVGKSRHTLMFHTIINLYK